MDIKTMQGSIGEAKTICKLLEDGYNVFLQFSGKSPFDLVAEKNNKLYRVEVKSTRTKAKNGKWIVQLKKVRPNRTKNIIQNFDSSSCDLLAIFIEPENKIIILDTTNIKNKTAITV